MATTQNEEAHEGSLAQEENGPSPVVESQATVEVQSQAVVGEEVETDETKQDDAKEEGEEGEKSEKVDHEETEELVETVPYVPSEPLAPIPMPSFTEFSFSIPELEPEDEEQAEAVPRPLADPPKVIHVPGLLKQMENADPSPNLEGIDIVHLGKEAGLEGEMQAMYLRVAPGTRTNRPLALRYGDAIVYCISGQGVLWQNGWTYPFNGTDCVGWKAGTGITHTIINDSNKDGGTGEDLVILMAYEVKGEEEVYYPLDPNVEANSSIFGGKNLWEIPPPQGELGRHPGVATMSPDRGNKSIPQPQTTYHPSNTINAIKELDAIGKGELFANATSLSQETGLSGRFGCNFEVPPPGARSSDAHAHSLEDELVYIVSGSGLVWLNGHVHPVGEGDVVGFPAGTGIAHCFINDSNSNGEEGEPLVLWIIGQNRRLEGDLVYYPLHPEKQTKRHWANCPKYDLGPHTGHPTRPFTG